MLLRPVLPADTPHLVALAERTGFFKPLEIEALGEVLDDFHAVEQANGHFAFAAEEDGARAGFLYYAPVAMTNRTWQLWWIAVESAMQGRGIRALLLRHAEEHIQSLGGRILFIETSSMPLYEPTRQFYLRKGYEITGVMRDFYADGDDMTVFRKRLQSV